MWTRSVILLARSSLFSSSSHPSLHWSWWWYKYEILFWQNRGQSFISTFTLCSLDGKWKFIHNFQAHLKTSSSFDMKSFLHFISILGTYWSQNGSLPIQFDFGTLTFHLDWVNISKDALDKIEFKLNNSDHPLNRHQEKGRFFPPISAQIPLTLGIFFFIVPMMSPIIIYESFPSHPPGIDWIYAPDQ